MEPGELMILLADGVLDNSYISVQYGEGDDFRIYTLDGRVFRVTVEQVDTPPHLR